MFEGRVISVRRHSVIEPDGVAATREIIHHRGSAVILPRNEDGKILLVRQFRFAVGAYMWELPAGSLDAGETPLQGSRRELAEETGCRAAKWQKIAEFYPSPGFLSEKMTIYLAEGIRTGTARPESDERIETRWFTPRECREMIRKGQICDAKTLVGLMCLWDARLRKGSGTAQKTGRKNAR